MHPRLHAESRPDATALIFEETGEKISFRQLEERANQAAHALRELGLQNGDAMVLASENRPEYLDVYWGAQRAGITLVPASSRLTAGELAYIVQDSGSRLLLVSQVYADTARGIAALRHELPGLARIVTIGTVQDFPDWVELCGRQPLTPIADEQGGSRMLYSSGTTGRPKGIFSPVPPGSPIQPHPFSRIFGTLYALGEDTVYLSPAPLYHSAPNGFTTAVQASGGTSVLMTKFEPEAFLAAIERYRVTAVQVVPTMFIRLLKLPDEVRNRYDLSSLKTVVHAAAPCPVPIKNAMIEWLGPIVEEYYSGTEGNGFVIVGSKDWLKKPGTVGKPLFGEIHICDDDGNEVPTGQTGAIYLTGGRDFHYHNDPEKTAKTRNLKHPTWSTMGDVGYLDEDGFLFLSDRKDFMIISGGVNIYPQEAENLLATHPDVADAAVFGVPNADFGEEVKAVIQPADWSRANEHFAEELIAWCRSQLADVKCPRSIDFERQLPRTETGKLFKKELKARYWPAA